MNRFFQRYSLIHFPLHETLSGRVIWAPMLVMAGVVAASVVRKKTAGTRCGTSVLKVNVTVQSQAKFQKTGIKCLHF